MLDPHYSTFQANKGVWLKRVLVLCRRTGGLFPRKPLLFFAAASEEDHEPLEAFFEIVFEHVFGWEALLFVSHKFPP